MSGRHGKELTGEDRILWDLVARSVTPAAAPRRSATESPQSAGTEEGRTEPIKRNEVRPAQLAPYQAPPPQPRQTGRAYLDTQTFGKLARGRLPLEARVDLHGMRQDEAYGLLLSFVSRAQSRGVRYVLVITGKGSSSGGDGVLRRSVPNWLSTAPFRSYVSAHESAAREHGGAGALYVRLKRVRNQ